MTRVPSSINPAPALECLLEVVGLVLIRVGKKPAGSIAVIAGDDQAPSGCESFHQAPEVIAGQMFLNFPGQRRQALARLVMAVQAIIRPVMPEHTIGFRADEVRAVLPGDVRRFRSRSGQFMSRSCTIVAERRTLEKPERLGEGGGIRGQFGPGSSCIVNSESALGSAVNDPGRLTQRERIEDKNGSAAAPAFPPSSQSSRGPRHNSFVRSPQVPPGRCQEPRAPWRPG